MPGNPFLLESEIANDPNFPDNWNGDWDHRFFEVGNITTDNKRTTWRGWAGLQGSHGIALAPSPPTWRTKRVLL
jgi:hypothetical protein